MSACIEWEKYRDKKNGYGVTSVGGKLMKAHRAAWVREKGQIPDGMCVLHRCDNRACVNVEHLWLGTYTDNNRDCRNKGRNRYPDNSGVLHGMSKISDPTAVRIKMLAGLVPQATLGKWIGLSQSQICDIMRGKAWKHVTAETRFTF